MRIDLPMSVGCRGCSTGPRRQAWRPASLVGSISHATGGEKGYSQKSEACLSGYLPQHQNMGQETLFISSPTLTQLTNKFGVSMSYSKKQIFIDYILASIVYTSCIFLYTGILKHNIKLSDFSNDGDAYYQLFYINWIKYSLFHGLNPLVTNYITYPMYYLSVWLTSSIMNSFLFFPTTIMYGPILTRNVIFITAPVFGAISMFALLRILRFHSFSSLLGGYIFGFSTYEVTQITNNIQLICIFPIPLLAILFVKSVRDDKTSKKRVAGYAILLSYLLWQSLELFTTATIFASILILLFIIFNKSIIRPKVFILKEIAISYIMVLLTSSIFFIYIIQGVRYIHGPLNSSITYSTDLLNFFIPTNMTLILGQYFDVITKSFTADSGENTAYIGLVLLGIVAFCAFENWDRKVIVKGAEFEVFKPFLLFTIILMVLSLGSRLHLDGYVTDINLPWVLFSFPPVYSAMPDRFTMYVFFCVSIWAVVFVEKHKGPYLIRYVLLICGIIMIVPNYKSVYVWGRPPLPSFISNGDYKSVLKKGSNVIILPRNTYSKYGNGALWVLYSNMYFHLAGQSWGYYPYWELKHPDLWRTESRSPRGIIQYCKTHDVDEILMLDAEAGRWKKILDETNFPHIKYNDVVVYFSK